MHLVVKARELNLPGRKPLFKGDHFEIDEMGGKTLKIVGKAEDPPPAPRAPVGHVATMRAEPQAEAAEAEASAPEDLAEPETDDGDAGEPAGEPDQPTRTYRTRRLKAEG
jgi:hypothetical protein